MGEIFKETGGMNSKLNICVCVCVCPEDHFIERTEQASLLFRISIVIFARIYFHLQHHSY